MSASDDDMKELLKREAAIQKKIAAKRQKEIDGVISQIVAVVDEYKIPIRPLVDKLGGLPSAQKGTTAPIKFHDPSTGDKWSGRGKLPIWLQGKNIENYRVSE